MRTITTVCWESVDKKNCFPISEAQARFLREISGLLATRLESYFLIMATYRKDFGSRVARFSVYPWYAIQKLKRLEHAGLQVHTSFWGGEGERVGEGGSRINPQVVASAVFRIVETRAIHDEICPYNARWPVLSEFCTSVQPQFEPSIHWMWGRRWRKLSEASHEAQVLPASWHDLSLLYLPCEQEFSWASRVLLRNPGGLILLMRLCCASQA